VAVHESSGYCENCGRQVLIRAQGVDHLFYLLLTLLCGGIALFFWVFDCIFWTPKWRCSQCGEVCRGPVDRSARVIGYVLLGLFAAAAVVGLSVCLLSQLAKPPARPTQRHFDPTDLTPTPRPSAPTARDREVSQTKPPRETPRSVPSHDPEPPRTPPPFTPEPDPPAPPPEPPIARGASKPAPGRDPFAPQVKPAEAKPAPPKTVTLNAAGRFLTVGDSPGLPS
jgi:hypothetical protein